ncbi:MAG TPA: hypothetical protein VMW87_04825, partial [Spirochaetia bacterium]|nr:hypothetical protein [Spirochaetia bacterium]
SREELIELDNGKPPSPGLSGIGITNVRERIELYFGPSYGVSFESTKGEGTVATIRLPAIGGNGRGTGDT